jgi:hypothetical protein
MNSYLLLTYLIMAATLGRGLLVAAKLAPTDERRHTCRRCRLPLERRALGERVCRCEGQPTP